MMLCDGIQIGVEYYLGKSSEWIWNGETRWWNMFVIFQGVHGGGGACVAKLWRWNGSSEIKRTDYLNLTYQETVDMIAKIKSTFLDSTKVEHETFGIHQATE